MFVNISSVANISTSATYKLINSWSLWPLAVDPTLSDKQLRAASIDDTPLEFQFRKSDHPNRFNLCAAYEKQTWCLDVFGTDKTEPHLSAWNYYTGQYWEVIPSQGTVKLSNDWTGEGWFLDIYSGTSQAYMSNEPDDSGQYWMLDLVASDVTLPQDAPDTDASSTTSAAAASTSTGSGHLSTPAIIGISLAGGILSASFLLAALALMFRRRRRRLKKLRQQDAAVAAFSSPPNHRHGYSHTTDSHTNLNHPHTPQQTSFFPTELESPVATYHPQRTVYELPCQDHDAIQPVMPKTSQLHLPEKDPNGLYSWPASPASSITSGHRTAPRWEEVVPDANGEITFVPASSLSPGWEYDRDGVLHRRAGGVIASPEGVHFTMSPMTNNLNAMSYGFGTAGGGMAGNTAPGNVGVAVTSNGAQERWGNGTWSSDGRDGGSSSNHSSGTTAVGSGGAHVNTHFSGNGGARGSGGGNDRFSRATSELDAHPPGYEGWPVYEVDGDRQHVYEAGGKEVDRLPDLPTSEREPKDWSPT